MITTLTSLNPRRTRYEDDCFSLAFDCPLHPQHRVEVFGKEPVKSARFKCERHYTEAPGGVAVVPCGLELTVSSQKVEALPL